MEPLLRPSTAAPRAQRRCSVAWSALTVVLATLGIAHGAAGEVLTETATIAGYDVLYRVVLPDGYDRTQTYPGVLAFGGGGQTLDIVDRAIERNWQTEAERRGYIVVSPVAPAAGLYFQGGDIVFPGLLDVLLERYPIAGRKFHVAGISNGGASAFHIAALYPDYFLSLTGLPGYLPYATADKLATLARFCIFMHVGERDQGWIETMQYQAQQLTAAGARLRFWIEPNEGHVMRSLQNTGAARLFEHFEAAAAGCPTPHP